MREMRLILACGVYAVVASIVSYMFLDNRAAEAKLLVLISPIGLSLGYVTAAHSFLRGRVSGGYLGLTQMSFWTLAAFAIQFIAPGVLLQSVLAVLTSIYLLACVALTLDQVYRVWKQPTSG